MFKRIFTFSGLVLSLLIFASLASASSPPLSRSPSGELYAPDRILVRFAPGISASTSAAIHRANGAALIGDIPQIGVQVLRVPSNRVPEMVAAYSRNPNVLYAEPDYIAHAVEDPNDPHFGKQWGLDNDGQEYKEGLSGTVDADIDAPEAWDITTGSSDVKIAILDSGVDQDHEDLASKIVADADFTGSGVDDRYGHGTHVAGIAAAATNNGTGMAGVGYYSSLMNGKVLNDQGSGYYSWIANGIIWAANNGANVINMSLGGYRRSRTLENAVNYAWNKGVVLAAAAGNDGTSRRLYPGAYTNCIAVAATDANDQRVDEPGWWASNYGDWVDVAAPGLYIYSTFPNHPYAIGKSPNYDYGSGTSMSTPHVAGLAGLLFGQDPFRTNADVRTLIASTADPITGTGDYWIHGRINACKAVGGNCPYGGEQPTPTPTHTATPTPTPTPTATPTPGPGGTMHVHAIDMKLGTVQRGPNLWTYAIATVTIVDQSGSPVEGATVSGYWSGATSDSDSGVTGADGAVSLESDKAKNAPTGTTFTFTVDDIVLSGWTYDVSANIQTTDSIAVP